MSALLSKNRVLSEMARTKTAHASSGQVVPLEANISVDFAEALYRTVSRQRPQTVVEIGMACGVSTLAILTALAELGEEATLISIDPHQASRWHGCGTEAVRRAGFQSHHQLIQDYSHVALPRLLGEKTKLDFAYIDGWHTFDYALLDFWFVDKMLQPGGIAAFNDCGLHAVDKVIRFVKSHRKYEELDVGLRIKFAGYSLRSEVRRIVQRLEREQFYRQYQDRYFIKRETWEPGWDFFSDF